MSSESQRVFTDIEKSHEYGLLKSKHVLHNQPQILIITADSSAAARSLFVASNYTKSSSACSK